MRKVIVIGAGIAGLTAAIRAAEAGYKVTVIALGVGGAQLSQSSVDVLGPTSGKRENPFTLIQSLPGNHPYHAIGTERLRNAISYFTDIVPSLRPQADTATDLPTENILLPSAIGAFRPTYLAPRSMRDGALVADAHFTIVGIREYKDLYPELLCGNLNRQTLPTGGRVFAEPRWINFAARAHEVDSNPVMLARKLDDPQALRMFAAALKKVLPTNDSSVGVPAILGYRNEDAHHELAELLGRPVFEIPSLPPALPGIRMNNQLLATARAAGVRLVNGARVLRAETSGNKVSALIVATAGRERRYLADEFIHAAGGFESFGLRLDSHGNPSEPIFQLPLAGIADVDALVNADWFSPQPLFTAGLAVDAQMRPSDHSGQVVYENLRAAGSILAGASRWQEKSGEGIAIGSAVAAADSLPEASSIASSTAKIKQQEFASESQVHVDEQFATAQKEG